MGQIGTALLLRHPHDTVLICQIVIESHSPLGDIVTFSASVSSLTTPTPGAPPSSPPAAAAAAHGAQQQHHENEYIRVTIRLAPGMTELRPSGISSPFRLRTSPCAPS